MSVIDQTGNIHRGAGSPDGGQFAGKVNTAPAVALDEVEGDDQEQREYQPVYRIPTVNLGALQGRLDRANARLKKAGIAERFTYTAEPRVVVNEETGLEYETNDVTLNTPRIACGEWEFDSVHEMAANGKVISYRANGSEPGDHVEVDNLMCDYCGHKRARTKIVVVTSPKTGERKQVGTNCLQLFLGVKPEGLWALTEDFEADELAVDDDELYSFRSPDATVVGGNDVLALTLRAVEDNGGVFISRGRATMKDKATADVVLERMPQFTTMKLTLSDVERAEIDGLLAWVDGMDSAKVSNYERNLQQALAKDENGRRLVARKHVPLVASAISAFRRNQQREAERALQQKLEEERNAGKKQAYLAAPGEKLKGRDVHATILSTRLGHDYGYGAPLHVTMLDDDGHVIYWKCSGVLGDSIETPGGRFVNWNPDDGTRVVIASGTVKDNRVSDYNGDWETVLTRAKLTPPADVIAGWDIRAPWEDEEGSETSDG